MAKELPYFKFDCSEWLTGDITLEDDNVQGVFITLCAYYWKQNCSTPIAKLKKRCKNDDIWDKLTEGNIIKLSDDTAHISFLDEQWEARQTEHNAKSEAGKQGAKKRWQTHSTPIKVPMAKHGNKDVDLDKDKEKIYKAVYDYYLTLPLKKHKKYTDSMSTTIRLFMKKTKSSTGDCCKLLYKHAVAVDYTKNNTHPITVRGITEFFGQKVYNGTELIAEQYMDGGKYFDVKKKPEEKEIMGGVVF